MMKNTFRYKLDFDDYLKFEKFNLRQRRTTSSLGIGIMFIAGAFVYNYTQDKSLLPYMLCTIPLILLVFFGTYYYIFNIRTKKNVKKYTTCDSSYFNTVEISIDERAIETKNIPQENEAGIVAVYPYSIMRGIFETKDYIYFIISAEVRILPKGAIPENMREAVLRQIKNTPKYMLLEK